MLNDSKLDDKLWVQAIDKIIFIINRGMLRNNCNMTPYELWKGRLAKVKYFKIYGRKCYIKREDKKFGKFDFHVDKGICIGYSCKRKAYRCYNLRWKQIVESINSNFYENCITKDDDEIVPLRKYKRYEGESMKDKEDLEQDQSNKKTIVNQEEIRNDQ